MIGIARMLWLFGLALILRGAVTTPLAQGTNGPLPEPTAPGVLDRRVLNLSIGPGPCRAPGSRAG